MHLTRGPHVEGYTIDSEADSICSDSSFVDFSVILSAFRYWKHFGNYVLGITSKRQGKRGC